MAMNKILKAYLFSFLLFCCIGNITAQNNDFEWAKNIDIYATLLKELQKNYVDEVDPATLNTEAIQAMLKGLDPYTVFISESDIENYKFMTTGQYGGIGSLIQKRDDYVIISQPYEGFPADKAELKPGDKIIAIDGKDMKGKTVQDVSELLKGEPNTSFTITIERYGDTSTKNITIKREVIKIDAVPYYGMVSDHIGYIKLRSFTEKAGFYVKNAFDSLKKHNDLEGLIFDLRGNTGGLLIEAVRIVNLFVDKDQVIVETKGKLKERNRTFKTTNKPVDKDIPIVVLINSTSASASEIVSGAMQDLDRGVLVGERSFGKGLVQNIIPLSYNTKAKITVAKYYIPSGRCIQEVDYSHKKKSGGFENVPDSLIKQYKTKNGRIVYDGKGILPDIEVAPDSLSRIALTLYVKNLIFDYANKFYTEHPEISSAKDFEITDDIYNDFQLFLKDKDFTYTTETEKALEKLKENAKNEKYATFIEAHLKTLSDDLQHHKNNDIITFQKDIKQLLKSEIIARYYYEKGVIISSFNDDIQLQKAVEILSNPSLYQSILERK